MRGALCLLRPAGRWALVAVPALVLLWAGLNKLADPAAFQEAVWRYRLLSWSQSGVVAWVLPVYELVLVACLLWRPLRREALLLMTALYAAFCGLLLLTWWRGLTISCGCFGVGSASVTTTLLMDLGLLASCVGACWALGLRPPLRQREDVCVC